MLVYWTVQAPRMAVGTKLRWAIIKHLLAYIEQSNRHIWLDITLTFNYEINNQYHIPYYIYVYLS